MPSSKQNGARFAGLLALALVCAGAPSVPYASSAPVPAAQVHIPESIPVRRDGATTTEDRSPARALVLTAMLAIIAVVVVRKYRVPLGASPLQGSKGSNLLSRWFRPAVRPDGVRLLHSLRLTPRSTVHVVQWDGRELLVGCSDQGVVLLGERNAASPPGDEAAIAPAEGKP